MLVLLLNRNIKKITIIRFSRFICWRQLFGQDIYNQNLSKTSINQFDTARLMERSQTVYNKNTQSVFETDIRLINRSYTVKAEYKSDVILNSLNIQSYRKAPKFQDCSIFQIEESRDQSNLTIINGKAEVKVFNSTDLKEIQQLSNINNSVTESIKYSSHNNLLITGGQDKSVIVYQYDNNQQYKSKTKLLGHVQTVKAVQFHKITNDTKIISGSFDQTIRIWDIQAEAQSLFVRVGSKVNTVDSFQFNQQIICGHNDGSIKLIQDKQIINTIYLDRCPSVTHVQVSQNENYALAANQDGEEITLIDLRMFKILQTFQNINYLNSSSYNKPTFAFNDKCIVAGSNDGDIYIWSIDDKLCPPSVIQTEKNATIHCSLYSSFSQKLFTTDSKGNLNIWKYG
ncbi:WD domain, G-beta repeat protein (macronuclear) [Tetrahymena thermophila SB210]|uniref:WD domain, G-beta repeat protein n=1 Tax=Tetrahymena thermophila (strain SB210) TaxID=312017 RepID=I7MAI2_TETTS|nr:WD domain, G-beta repeat protein [Tetrahymena thermophila SB210]EAS04647.4 WD domain, G-beta repeat protein [Tetrahymena thermophila SB210]|eukprot:XP_001024892.4 WD domain, G-beta repeat protein [Tetrahymena thermophila SB210]